MPTTTEPTRAEHLAWCKQRALEYCEADDMAQAWASMASDMSKHDETRNHAALELGMMMLMVGQISTSQEMAQFIRGFN